MAYAAAVEQAPREKILDAAEDLFARRGFSGVGLSEIAEAVGLGKSTLFHLVSGRFPVSGGEIRLNEELADYRRISPEKLKPWDFGTGLALRDWLNQRGFPRP